MTDEHRVSFRSGTLSGRSGELLFGDRRGLALFLGALVLFGLGWRVGFFVSDTVAVANTLVNVVDGSLTVTKSPYALTLGSQPGLYDAGNTVIGRNYGHILVALPLVVLLEAVTALVDLRLVLLAAWVVCLVSFAGQVATLLARPRFKTVGSALALGLFVPGVLWSSPLSRSWIPLVSLQLVVMLAAALSVTLLYRLLARVHGPRVGVAGALALLLASPVTFWASLPKRHVLTGTAVTAGLVLFVYSRRQQRGALAARSGTYAVLGLLATLHAFEAAFLTLALVPVDLLTAPRNRPRDLAAVALVGLLSLLPVFLLNIALTGNPLKPPRVLSPVDVGAGVPDLGSDFPSPGGGAGSGGGGSDIIGLLGPVGAAVEGYLAYLGVVVGFLVESVVTGLDRVSDVDRLWHTFVRSGRIPMSRVDYAVNEHETIELALLEVLPLAGALLVLPVVAARRVRDTAAGGLGELRAGLRDPGRATDLLAGTWVATLVVIYIPLLPLHTQITVRYLLPVVPLLVYGVARLGPVRTAVTEESQRLAGGYVTVVVGGTLLVVAVLAFADPAVGEAMQFHALVGLAAGSVLGAVAVTWPLHRSPRAVATALATAAGVTTIFLALTALAYFPYGEYALAPVRVAADLLPLL